MDIVKVPIANDWAILNRQSFCARIRRSVNAMLAGIAQPTVSDRKDALRAIALQSPQNFKNFRAVKEHVRTYDPNVKWLAYYRMKSIFASGFEGLKSEYGYDLARGPEEITELVHDTLEFFKQHVENGNLWEERVDDKPKKARRS